MGHLSLNDEGIKLVDYPLPPPIQILPKQARRKVRLSSFFIDVAKLALKKLFPFSLLNGEQGHLIAQILAKTW